MITKTFCPESHRGPPGSIAMMKIDCEVSRRYIAWSYGHMKKEKCDAVGSVDDS